MRYREAGDRLAEEREQGLDLLLTLVQNTMEADWDMTACVCIVCSLGRMMNLRPRGMANERGLADPSLPFRVPVLEVRDPPTR